MKFLLLVLLFPFAALAEPFLTCDPYPPTGAQPTEFVVTISGVDQPIVTPAVNVEGGKAMMLDLGPLNLTGERTFTARARNAGSESAESQPFTALMGTLLLPPNNLRTEDVVPVVRYLGLEPGSATGARGQATSWDVIRAVATDPLTVKFMGARVIAPSDGNFRLAVFGSLQNGDPDLIGGPLAYVDEVFSATAGIHEGVLTQPVQIVAGAVYWLGIGHWRTPGTTTVTWAAEDGAGERWRLEGGLSADTPPDAWPTSGFSYSADTTYEIYLGTDAEVLQ